LRFFVGSELAVELGADFAVGEGLAEEDQLQVFIEVEFE
jgi:hypothetical protein